MSDSPNTNPSEFDLDRVELTDDELANLTTLLRDPIMWDQPATGAEDALIAEMHSETTQRSITTSTNVTSITSRSRIVRSAAIFATGIAAGMLLIFSVTMFKTDDNGVELALTGTELAPLASASALIDQGPLGVRIILDVTGLAPSPNGTYYQAWVRKSPEAGVSAGTFHLRGGDGEIELWAGVSTDEYPLIAVTLQQEGEGTESSGKVVLKGRLD